MRRNSSSSSPGPRQPDASRDFLAGFRELDRVLHNLRHDRADLFSRVGRNPALESAAGQRGRDNAIGWALSGIESMTEPSAQQTDQDARHDISSRSNAYPGWSIVRSLRARDFADRSLWESLTESNALITRPSPYIECRIRKIMEKRYSEISVVPCSYLSFGITFSGVFTTTSDLPGEETEHQVGLTLNIESVDLELGQIYGSARWTNSNEKVFFVDGLIADFSRSALPSCKQLTMALRETLRWHRLEPFSSTTYEQFLENQLDDTTIHTWLENFIFLRLNIEQIEGVVAPFLVSMDRNTGQFLGTLDDDDPSQKFNLWPDSYMSQDTYSWR